MPLSLFRTSKQRKMKMISIQQPLQERVLGNGFTASAVSFGAMGMSEFYGTPPEDEASLQVLDRALELGVTMFDTADMYGRGHNERLIGRFIARHHREYIRGFFRIATKFGIDRAVDDSYKRSINNAPGYIRQACDASLQRLGVERIDLYYAHRINPQADLAATMETLADLVKIGKVAHIGVCEVSAATLRKAHKIHPITAVQSEYSLWTREMETEVLPTCRELGIGFVAYSPLGRGFLTGALSSTQKLENGDFRLSNPRFQEDNLQQNRKLLPALKKIAGEHNRTPAQIALAWLLAREKRLIPIPGTRYITRLEENCAAAQIQLLPEDMDFLENMFVPEAVHGSRYTPEGMQGANA